MIPDIAAMMIAMIMVTTPTPPRTRRSQASSASYMSLAIPDRSMSEAMRMNIGTEISTYSVQSA